MVLRKKIIVDTDPGNGIPGSDIDDALAISTALLSPDLELLGLTTVAGNVDLEDANRSALQLVELAQAEVPVCAGAAVPLVADPAPIRSASNARRATDLVRELWASVPSPPPTRQLDGRAAAEFIIDTVMAQPGNVTLVPIGPLTNIATALLLQPKLAQSVQGIVMMAGAVRVPGTITPATEMNACYDPEATHIVLTSGAPITMVGLDVTTRTSFSLEHAAALRQPGTPLGEYLADICEPYIRYVMQRRGLRGCWLHDPLAVCVAIDPSIVRVEPMYIGVELHSQRFRGQTVGWSEQTRYMFPGGASNAQVCMEVDNSRFMDLLLGILGVPAADTRRTTQEVA